MAIWGIGAIGSLIVKEIKGPITRTVNNTIDKKFKEHHEKFKEDLKLKYKYNHTQFDIYSEIWSSLMDIDIYIDELWTSENWNDNDNNKVNNFLEEAEKGFKEARAIILRKSIFINKDHLKELKKLFPWVKDYCKGKGHLRDIRFGENYPSKKFELNNERKQIQFNEIYRAQWKGLLTKLEEEFRNKLSMEDKL